MFYCQITRKVSKPGEAMVKIVVSKRQKVYPQWKTTIIEGRKKVVEAEPTIGWEIVRELSATEFGNSLWNGWTEEERAAFLNAY